jgi:SAM-dependent methyltransferase
MIELDVPSPIAHVRVYRRGSIRQLAFVRPDGSEQEQSEIDLGRPAELRYEYLRAIVEAPRYSSQHDRVLLVGLGGGALAHHYRARYPRTIVDAVEIDPLVVAIARVFFALPPETRVAIADASRFLRSRGPSYDVVYVDAFLPVSKSTAPSGRPRHLGEDAFLRSVRQGSRREGSRRSTARTRETRSAYSRTSGSYVSCRWTGRRCFSPRERGEKT